MGSDVVDADVLRRSLVEPSAFGLVYERHGDAVARYLARRVGHGAAEDLTAEVFVLAFRGRSTYLALHGTALPWLLGIASNVIAGHRRSERRRLAALERLASRAAAIAMPEGLFGIAPELVGALRRLSAVDRDTFLLVVWGELSYDEAASALGVPVGTIRSRLARARGQLEDAANTQRSVRPRAGRSMQGDSRA